MRDFLERTDTLALKLGISLRSLAPAIGMSVASLFGYRNGSIPISNKAWRKLEQAECKAGIGMEEDSLDLDQPIPEELAARFAEIVKPLEDAKAKLAEAAAPIREMREEMASMQQRLGNIEILLERLLEKDTAPQTSSPARGKTA